MNELIGLMSELSDTLNDGANDGVLIGKTITIDLDINSLLNDGSDDLELETLKDLTMFLDTCPVDIVKRMCVQSDGALAVYRLGTTTLPNLMVKITNECIELTFDVMNIEVSSKGNLLYVTNLVKAFALHVSEKTGMLATKVKLRIKNPSVKNCTKEQLQSYIDRVVVVNTTIDAFKL